MPFFKKWACKEKKVRRMSKILRIFACLFALFLLLMRLVRGIHALRRPRNIHHANPDIKGELLCQWHVLSNMSRELSELGGWEHWSKHVL